MLGMLRTAMPSKEALLRSSRVPSHCQAHRCTSGPSSRLQLDPLVPCSPLGSCSASLPRPLA